MFCKYCGKEQKDDAKFCSGCGKQLNSNSAPMNQSVQQANPEPEVKTVTGRGSSSGMKPVVFLLIFIVVAALAGIAAYKIVEMKAEKENEAIADFVENEKEETNESDDNKEDEAVEIDKTETEEVKDEDKDKEESDNEEEKDKKEEKNLWVKAYLDFITEDDFSDRNFGFIYVNEDDIPELVLQGMDEATGNIILTYSEDGVDELQTSRLNFDYADRKNMLNNSDGHMGYYYDTIYCIKDGKWDVFASGSYYVEDNATDWDEDDLIYEWNGERVSKDEYYSQLNEVYGGSGKKGFNGKYTYGQIVDLLEDYEKTDEPDIEEKTDYFVDSKDIHEYSVYIDDVSWDEALEKCQDKGGYLVRINSKDEYKYIVNMLRDNNQTNLVVWLSGMYNFDDGHYHWYDGDKFDEAVLEKDKPFKKYWLEGEPSYESENADGDIEEEHYMDMFYSKKEDEFVWNDVPSDISRYYPGRIAYICEFER